MIVRFAQRFILCLLAAIAAMPARGATISQLVDFGNAVDIPDAGQGVFSSNIVINDPRLVASAGDNVTVTLLGFGHTWSGDLIATLTYLGPTTISSDLFNRIGQTDPSDPFDLGDSSNFDSSTADYAFNSAFTGDLWAVAGALGDADSIPGGNYFPTTALGTADNLSSVFNGLPVSATWNLTISDNSPGETGVITGWQLDINVPDAAPVSEPSYTLFTALALVILMVRFRVRATG